MRGIVGLTGGIAAGKSAVAGFLKELGVPVIDADDIARELRSPGGAAHQKILNAFNTNDAQVILKKMIDDPIAKQKLEKILHPLIQIESENRINQLFSLQTTPKYIVYEAALLIETGRYKQLKYNIGVGASTQTRMSRLLSRKGMTSENAQAIISLQSSDEEKKKCVDYWIENNDDLDSLRQKVIKIHNQILTSLI